MILKYQFIKKTSVRPKQLFLCFANQNIYVSSFKRNSINMFSSSESSSGVTSLTIPSHASVSALLWARNQKEAFQSLHNPWVVSLSLGSLQPSSFAQYIAQDAFFLESFAKGYAFALGKCKDRQGIVSFHKLIGAVLEELNLHSGLAQKWGLSLDDLREPNCATEEYVKFLQEVSQDSSSTTADILASMAPCMRLYAFLGQKIKKSFDVSEAHPFAEWISTYSSNEFEEAAQAVEALLDRYSEESSIEKLSELYKRAMELEYNFFNSQAMPDVPKVPLIERIGTVFIDFDETCTTADTTPLFLELAKAEKPTHLHQELDRKWQELTDLYLADYRQVLSEVLEQAQQEGPLNFIDAESLIEKLETYFQRLTKVSNDSVQRVVDCKILEGIKKASIPELLAGPLRSKWELQEGCSECLHSLARTGVPLKIISINWSSVLISSILQSHHIKTNGGLNTDICSNDLDMNEADISTGNVIRSIDGAIEKKETVMWLKQQPSTKHMEHITSFTLFFGDSLTDLTAMLSCDIPVLFGASNSFRLFCSSVGIVIKPLLTLHEVLASGKFPHSAHLVIYETSGWNEIYVLLFGKDK